MPERQLTHQSGSLDADPGRRTAACQYDSCPANTNTPTGTNSSDTRLNWVNSFPATSIRYGINSIGPSHWGGAAPELAVAGPNVGSNVYRKHKDSCFHRSHSSVFSNCPEYITLGLGVGH